MKQDLPLEKTAKNLCTCHICGRIGHSKKSTNMHVYKLHKTSSKEYYDTFYKSLTDGKCIVCGNNTEFLKDIGEYRIHCSISCVMKNPINIKSRIENNMKTFGVKNPAQSQVVKNKIIKTCLLRYGVKCVLQDNNIKKKTKETCLAKYGKKYATQAKIIKDKIRNTNLKRYGVASTTQLKEIRNKQKITCKEKYGYEYPIQSKIIKDKIKQTNILKYGSENPFASPVIQQKIKQTNTVKYGVVYPMQNRTLHEKQQKSAYKSNQYILPSGNIIYKMGYESHFLDYVFHNNILKEIEIIYYPKTIKYININNKQAVYHPDFYIPKWNLIVEIKSLWTEKLDKNVTLKEIACKNQGFNYIRIVDKNYDILNKAAI